MNTKTQELIFRAKNLHRAELADLPVADKFRLIEALHQTGMRLRKLRPQIGSFGVSVRRSMPTSFKDVQQQTIVNLSDFDESLRDAA